jgi:polar amino acid transport system substrate-binding protein
MSGETAGQLVSGMAAAARRELARHGVLRAGINLSNPLLVSARTPDGGPDGVAPALAAVIAERLGVPCQLVPYTSPGLLGDLVDADEWDIALIADEPARAAIMTFSPPYVELAATYLTPPGSAVTSVQAADTPGTRIIAVRRTAYELWLSANLEHAELVLAGSHPEARELFAGPGGHLLAGLTTALGTAAAELPGTTVLPGRFMAVRQAVACRPADQAGAAFLRGFVAEALASGLVADLTRRYGVADSVAVPAGALATGQGLPGA